MVLHSSHIHKKILFEKHLLSIQPHLREENQASKRNIEQCANKDRMRATKNVKHSKERDISVKKKRKTKK